MTDSRVHRLVIAGAGVAGIEALLALHAMAGDRVQTTVVSPEPDFSFRAHSVEEPFAGPAARRWSVADICADHDAAYLPAALTAVDADAGRVTTDDGGELAFDSLLVAVGARHERFLEGHAVVFAGDRDAEAMHGLIQDIELGDAKRVAFVVPAGVTWPLPLYELALMTAERAREMCQDDLKLMLLTPEELPLGVLGGVASAALSSALDRADIEVLTGSYVRRIIGGSILVDPSGVMIPVDRIVAVPRLSGPRVPGLPADEHGFIHADRYCRVHRVPGAFAAGDGTTYPIKQGGLAAQQANVAALGIAERAGADVTPKPFDPTLRVKLLTGTRAKYLRDALGPDGGEETSTASDHALWWPPSKVAAPHLSAYLAALEAGTAPPHAGTSPPVAIHAQGDPDGGVELLGSST
jgi:sulfide:quinone oxidoreductase